MSLAIQVDDVAQVLLADGHWYLVEDVSFDLDSYEFLHGEVLVQPGGHYGVCASGFTFKHAGAWMSGPLTAILAVKMAKVWPAQPPRPARPTTNALDAVDDEV